MTPTEPKRTESIGPTEGGPEATAKSLLPLDQRERRRLFWSVVLRVVLISLVLLLGYFLLPVGIDRTAFGAVVLFGGIALLVVVTAHQLRRILNAEHPQLRAVEAVATVLPLFLVVFAYTYVWMSKSDPANFSQPIGRIDGLYFVVTVLTTTGFGDITPTTSGARVIVTVQMLLDLVLIGVVAKLIVGASRIAVRRRQAEAARDPHAIPTETGT
jgi:hypothetical protein